MKKMMTMREAAEVLGVHVNTLYLKREEMGLPALKVGGRWRVPKADFEEWIEDRTERG